MNRITKRQAAAIYRALSVLDADDADFSVLPGNKYYMVIYAHNGNDPAGRIVVRPDGEIEPPDTMREEAA